MILESVLEIKCALSQIAPRETDQDLGSLKKGCESRFLKYDIFECHCK